MSKKSPLVTLVVVILITALALGGGRWLWHLFLKMHGMR